MFRWFRLGRGVDVRYVDRWEPEQNLELFPELEGATFPRPDLVCDLNAEGLTALPSASEDFIVACHVLEHMANPLRVLADFHRVVKPGGVLLILLPDRRLTFDRGRPATTLAHLVEDQSNQVDSVDEDHLLEFMAHVGVDDAVLSEVRSGGECKEAILEFQRKRSIHVHCWNLDEFVEVVEYSIEHLGHHWELVDGLIPDEHDPAAEEFGLVLRRTSAEIPGPEAARRFRSAATDWSATFEAGRDLKDRGVEDGRTSAHLPGGRCFGRHPITTRTS